jgi:DNA-binding NarL/FixJ family response regulator
MNSCRRRQQIMNLKKAAAMKPQAHLRSRPTLARLIIADDHELARAGLRNMLAGDRGLTLVGEASNGREALELCQELQPDLALLDIRMPEMDGLTATQAIRQACPQTRVLIMTTHANPDYLLAALKAGAAGYVLKDIDRHELLSTIRRVLTGASVLSGEIAARALQHMVDQQSSAPSDQLTPREREVLAQIVEGHTNRQIAQVLSISLGTVKFHVEHIIGKLGVTDRTQAAVRAVERGLLHTSEDRRV